MSCKHLKKVNALPTHSTEDVNTVCTGTGVSYVANYTVSIDEGDDIVSSAFGLFGDNFITLNEYVYMSYR